MAVDLKELNWLDLTGRRVMPFLPPHFAVYEFVKDNNIFDRNALQVFALGTSPGDSEIKILCRWITQNLQGRFFVGNSPTSPSTVIFGFEEHPEATYFGLVAHGLVAKKDS